MVYLHYLASEFDAVWNYDRQPISEYPLEISGFYLTHRHRYRHSKFEKTIVALNKLDPAYFYPTHTRSAYFYHIKNAVRIFITLPVYLYLVKYAVRIFLPKTVYVNTKSINSITMTARGTQDGAEAIMVTHFAQDFTEILALTK